MPRAITPPPARKRAMLPTGESEPPNPTAQDDGSEDDANNEQPTSTNRETAEDLEIVGDESDNIIGSEGRSVGEELLESGNPVVDIGHDNA
eukprot:EC838562.1.p4 GENE.EC838562.1~~EC838562.1.p4  ORF type:complete len:91 (-),score=15.53 EC838562.1:330-602(-)